MRYFYDCEFIEDGKTIDLISIGVVAEDGRELYLQSVEFDANKANDWVFENVLTHLVICPHDGKVAHSLKYHGNCSGHDSCPWYSRAQMKHRILHFMDIEKYGEPELWGYYSAYDHVVFCQLFGTMMDLPRGFPMYTRDLKQWCDALGNPALPKQEVSEHHALADARWNRLIWQILSEGKA